MSTATITAVSTTPFPFDRIFPTNRITILWGSHGAGKSSMTNHYELQHVKAGGKLLHIEVDETFDDMKPRLADINEHVKCSLEMRRGRFTIMRPTNLYLDTEEGAAKLKAYVLEYKPTLLVLSPIGMLVKEEVNSQKVTAALFKAIKDAKAAHPCTVILHGHLNKRGLPTGSVYWSALTDMSWLLEKLPDLEEDEPHRMQVSALKGRVEGGMGFEWLLLPPNHGIAFVNYRRDSLTVEERFALSTVLGFVYDKYKANWIEVTKRDEREMFDHATGRKRKKAANKWVTVADFINEHEQGLGGKTAAYKAFGLARERSLIGQLTNGDLGVQRFYPTDRTVRWLQDNSFGHHRSPPPPAIVNAALVPTTVGSSAPVKTEDERNIESWKSRPEEEKAEWTDEYDPHPHELLLEEQENERIAKRFRELDTDE